MDIIQNTEAENTGIDPNAGTSDTTTVDNTAITTQPDPVMGSDNLNARLDALVQDTSRNVQTPQTPAATQKPADTTAKAGQQTPQSPQVPQQQQPVQPRVAQQQPDNSANFQTANTPRIYGSAYKVDPAKNVVDARTGEVIAYAGAERKAFERMLPHINALRQEGDRYRTALETATNANAVAAKLNLTPEEFSIGARIMNVFKSDPKQAIRFMLQEATNNGIDVSDLGGGAGLSVNAIKEAVQSIVSEAIKPFSVFTQERQQQEEQNALRAEANEFIEGFIAQHPDSRIHLDSIAKIMNARPGTDPETAYLILQNHALRNGLDWSQPLEPQVRALVARQQNGTGATAPVTGQPANQGNGNSRPLPNMNGRVNNGSIGEMPVTALPAGKDNADIVREAMRMAGIDTSNL